MKNILMISAVAAICALGTGCGSACDDLACDSCKAADAGAVQAAADANLKAACEAVVNTDNDDTCQAAVDSAIYDSCK